MKIRYLLPGRHPLDVHHDEIPRVGDTVQIESTDYKAVAVAWIETDPPYVLIELAGM